MKNRLSSFAVRSEIVSSKRPPKTEGTVGPNLGVVELTIALHLVFDTPKDSFFWDVPTKDTLTNS